jgi:hypothetical protein
MAPQRRPGIALEKADDAPAQHRFAAVARFKRAHFPAAPRIQSLYESTFLAGLRLAGVPDE